MRTAAIAAGLYLSFTGSCFAQTPKPVVTRVETRIPPQPLESALRKFAKVNHIHVLYLTADVKGLNTSGATGYLTENEALTRLLSGTGLKYCYVDANAVSVVAARTERAATTQAAIRVSAAESSSSESHEKVRPVSTEDHPDNQSHSSHAPTHNQITSLSEVVITGTHIAGVNNLASPTSTYYQNYIYSTGAGNIGEFISQLPTNFAEASEMNSTTTPSGPGGTIGNRVGAVGFDIHGLGVQSTLVLVNGFRVAAGNNEGNFVDVSMLPLSAIERIDIVKDSASAIYGSDAVGGVVNIVTIPRFDGSVTSVRYGSVARGSRTETTASATAGTSWGKGSAVLSYEYGNETPLAASSRPFSENAASPFSLLPEQSRHSLYGTISQRLGANYSLTGFLLLGRRTMEDSYFFAAPDSVIDSNTAQSLTAEVGVQKNLVSGGIMRAAVEYSSNDSHHSAFLGSRSTPRTYSPYGNDDGKSRLGAFDLDYSGEFALLTRQVIRYAIGGQVREERLSYTNYLPYAVYQPDRAVTSEYLELHVPIVTSVVLTAAYRHEHYSDFGATNDPKIGLQWTPNRSISLSGTYSRAFRAPALFDLNPVPTEAVYIPLADPRIGGVAGTCGVLPPPQVGCTPVLLLFGGNPHLQAETANTWTANFRLHPVSLPGFTMSLGFYDIRYFNRINQLEEAVPNPLNALQAEGELGGSIIQRNVPNQMIQQLALGAGLGLFNFGAVNPGAVSTLVDGRSLNVSRLSTRGLDFEGEFTRRVGRVLVTSALGGTRIIEYRTQFTSSTLPIDALDTAYNPLSLKLKAHESASLGPMTASIFVNYAGPYTNNELVPNATIASWLTFDVSGAYHFQLGTSQRRSVDVTLGCLNVADRNPPFVSNPAYLINFDGANASPLGRFVYAEARVFL